MLRKILTPLLVLTILTLASCSYIHDPVSLSIELNPGIDTIEVNTSFIDAGATAYLDGDIYEDMIVIENSVDSTKVGLYKIVYQTSFRRNDKRITRFVNVIDKTPPKLTLRPGIDTIKVGEPWLDPGVLAIDNSHLEVKITITGQVISWQIGEYIITYRARDYYGNISYISRYVSVID